MNKLVEIGINLMNKKYHQDREQVVKRAIDCGVSKMIITGTNLKNSEEAAHYAKKHPGITYSTAGYHPHDAKNFNNESIEKLKTLLKENHVVAVGECGLDFNRDFSPRDVQVICFEEQLKIAREIEKPLFLHERDAHQKIVNVMKNYEDLIPKSVIHCFTGNEKEVKEYIEMGFYIGITGWICDVNRGKELRKAVRHIPLDRLLIETDGPYLTPRDLIPKPKDFRNEPMYLPHIVKAIARCMGVSEDEVAKHSTKNAENLFRFR